MLNQYELDEIRNHLENSQNPLFFFDNDADGLCAFLILQRAIHRGKGVAIKSFPELNEGYFRKINELNPDAVFILDKPRVSKEFIEKTIGRNIPVIWIDHHNVQVEKEIQEKINYYNSSPSEEPTTYIAYKVFNNKKDQWLAMIGCIGDVFMPEFNKEFSEQYPEIYPSPKINAFDSLFKTELGKIVDILNFGLKDTTTNVLRLMKYLLNAKSPYDILEETPYTRTFHKRYNELNSTLQKLLNKSKENAEQTNNLVFFSYSGETSMSAELSNALSFQNKNKIIAVAFKKQDKANISIRGKKAKEYALKAIEKIENSTGGGHEEACGATVPIEKLEEFKNNLKELTNGK